MPNTYKNKVVVDGSTIIDLTADTVTPAALMQGYTAHDASGAPIVGTSTAGTMVIRDTQDSHGGTVREITAGSVVAGTKTITANGTYDVAEYADASVSVPSAEPELQAKTATPSTSQQVITADSGYDGLSQVTVSAMPSGSATTPTTTITANPSISVNSSTGLITASVSGSKSVTPSVSAGYVSSGTAGTVSVSGSNTSQLTTQAAKTVTPSTSSQTAVAAGRYTTGAVTVAAMPSGTAGTPTAAKGTASNHSVSVTPSVTNTTGYITGGTKSGTAVTVSASELVSGTLSITSSGTHDVTNYASASVAAGGATASVTKGSVSNHSVTVTPSVTRTAGYVTAGTADGTAVTVSASELVSGSQTITENGTVDVTNLASVDVEVESSGGPTYTVTLTNAGHYIRGYVQLNGEGTTYYTSGQTIEFHSGDTLRVHVGSGTGPGYLYVDDELVAENTSMALTYDYQLPDGNVSVRFVPKVVGYCYITLSTLDVTADGVYDVSQYLKANVRVAGYTATITHTVGSSYTYPSIQVNGTGTRYYADGATFKFNDGDTLKILLQGTRSGGTLYLNGTQVYGSGQDSANYTWTPPSCDLSIDIQTDTTGLVYVTTPVMNISANGSYEVPGYGYVNVSV